MSVPLRKSILFLVLAISVAGFAHQGAQSVRSATAEPGLALRLPFVLSNWYGETAEPGFAEKTKLPPDTEIEKKIYAPRSAGLKPLQVTIVLSGKDRTSIHRPEVCLTAQGWNIESATDTTVKLANGENLTTRRLAITRDGGEAGQIIYGTYLYWFVGTDFTTPDHVKRILYTATNNLIRQSNPRWAYVSILSTGKDSGSAERWMAEAVPQFQKVYETAALF